MACVGAAFQRQLKCRDCLNSSLGVAAAIDISKSDGYGKLHIPGTDLKTGCLSLIRKDFPAQLVISIRVSSPGQTTCSGWAVFIISYYGSVYVHSMRLYLESGRHIRLRIVNTPFIYDAEIGTFYIGQPSLVR